MLPETKVAIAIVVAIAVLTVFLRLGIMYELRNF